MEFRLFLSSVSDGRRGQGRLSDWVLNCFAVARVARGGMVRPEGLVPRRLFDNFIGRKRDVDGGVLAGFFGAQALEGPKRQLTVTFQTTIPVEPGFDERRETDGELIGWIGSVFGTRHNGASAPREVEGFPAKETLSQLTGQ